MTIPPVLKLSVRDRDIPEPLDDLAKVITSAMLDAFETFVTPPDEEEPMPAGVKQLLMTEVLGNMFLAHCVSLRAAEYLIDSTTDKYAGEPKDQLMDEAVASIVVKALEAKKLPDKALAELVEKLADDQLHQLIGEEHMAELKKSAKPKIFVPGDDTHH